jgi:hypothetical protein
LARFVPSEWPGGVDEWRTAALAWLAEHKSRRLPFGVYGDSVAVFRESARVKREAAGMPAPPSARRSRPERSDE